MSLLNPELWRLQAPQASAVTAIFEQLQRDATLGAAIVSGFQYDVQGRLTEFIADGTLCTIAYPDDTHINVVYGTNLVQVTLNAQQQIIGVIRL